MMLLKNILILILNTQISLVSPIHHFQISSQTVLVSFLQPLHPIIGLLQVCLHATVVCWALLHQILAYLNVQQLGDHVPLDPSYQGGLARHVVNVSVIHKEAIQAVIERHWGVESIRDGLIGALIHGEWLEGVRINPGSNSEFLVLYELLLHPGEAKLRVTIIILEPVPAHHVQDVKDAITLTVDAVQDGVLVPAPALVPVTSRQVTGEAFHLLPTLAVDFSGAIGSNNKVPPSFRAKKQEPILLQIHRHFYQPLR